MKKSFYFFLPGYLKAQLLSERAYSVRADPVSFFSKAAGWAHEASDYWCLRPRVGAVTRYCRPYSLL